MHGAAPAPSTPGPEGERPAWRWPTWTGRGAAKLALAVAGTAVAGYLVAALLLFPAPLLPSERHVPRVIGTPIDEAQRTLQANGFRAEIAERQFHPTYPPGSVTWQDPAPGVAAPRSSAVALTVSRGPSPNVVPDVRGLDAQLAQLLLHASGIGVESVDSVGSQLPAGVATGTDPAAGRSVASGRRVTLHLSKGAR
jgi:beta-lactam-binding protein with PASTA domain